MYGIIGLGNVGEKYKGTRHNTGFMVIDALASKWKITLKKVKYFSFYSKGTVKRGRNKEAVALVKPITYVNLSGIAVKPFIDDLMLPTSHLIIIHDDLDIPIGKFKIKIGGGPGGHKGITSVLSLVDSNFIRIKVGIGRPLVKTETVDYVLSQFSLEEKTTMDQVINDVTEAVELIIFEGIEKAQTVYNR
ncbi:MAG: aminoacyl-tRNA hydrolase [Caldisericaceae bacterium]|nr:aminoacyl-tRNA hydrolase [Caldisericaceae bacterium]